MLQQHTVGEDLGQFRGELGANRDGVAVCLMGQQLVMDPGAGLLAVIWLVGIYAVVFGISLLMLGFRLKNVAGELPAPTVCRAR